MDRGRGGSSPPSFREVVVNKTKTPPESGRGSKMEEEKLGKRTQNVTRRRRMKAQNTRRKMTKNKEQKTGNKRDGANLKLKLLPE